MERMKRIYFLLFFMGIGAASAFALPYIPGCPLHDSCVRALKQ